MKKYYFLLLILLFAALAQAQTFGTPEIANNETFANAQLISNPEKISGNIFPKGDVDWYKFTGTPGDRIYVGVMSSFSASGSSDAQLRLFGSDGTTLIEFDDDDGTLGGLSSTIAGAVLPAGTGTYYLQVKHFSATNTLRGYDMYFRLQSGSPTPEVESNNTPGTANPMPPGGWVSGSRNPAVASEQDFFYVSLLAGESVFISMDLDPERDNVQYNGRLGFALFGDAGNQVLVVDDGSTGSVLNPLSEAFFFTAKDAGTYYVFADAASPAVGGPTATYHISFTKFAATPGYVNYPSTDVPKTIGPGTSSVTSSLTITDSKLIKDLSVRITLNHTVMQQIDATLTSPDGNVVALFTDIGSASVGGQNMMDLVLNDNNAIPPLYTTMKVVAYQPEFGSKLDLFKGMNTLGTWFLTLYDDAGDAHGGTLTSWSLNVLESVPPNLTGAITIANEDFEASDGGFTHSGIGDEWEWGTPATLATSTTNAVAGFTTANSGSKCWKTDLDDTYNINCEQVLLTSPVYSLTTATAPIWLSWAMKYQLESADYDTFSVYVEEVGTGEKLKLYEWLGATLRVTPGSPATNIGMSGGWGTHWADISLFAGKQIQFKVLFGTDNSINYGGIAIDDVKIFALGGFPLITASGTPTITTESCTPTNTAIDPGETVTVSFCVTNAGTASTTNLVGTLQATGGVTNPGAPVSYGTIGPAGDGCGTFTFTATGICGSTLTATIIFTDGGTYTTSVDYTFTLGTGGPAGCCTGTTPVIEPSGRSLVTENCTPTNTAVDPGETVTVSFCVTNVGTASTTNMIGTLQPTGGVTSPGASVSYGSIIPTGSGCGTFTFTANGTCGGILTATITFQDGANNLGSATYTFTLGTGGAGGCCVISMANITESGTPTLTSESCNPGNGAIDPDEIVNVSFCVTNSGTTSTTNAIGTLQISGGITNPSGPVSYGTIIPGGVKCGTFTFTTKGTCGDVVTATITFMDGASNIGSATYTFTLGTGGPAGCCIGPFINFTATTAQGSTSTTNNFPTQLTLNYCQGGFVTYSGFSSIVAPNIGMLETIANTSGNVTYNNVLVVNSGPTDYSYLTLPAFFSATYGPYGTNDGIEGTETQEFTPYQDIDFSGSFTPGDVLGDPITVLHKIYPVPTANIFSLSNDPICAGGGTNVNLNGISGTNPFLATFKITWTGGGVGASSTLTRTFTIPPNPQSIPIPPANLTNTGPANATYFIEWISLQSGGCTTTNTASLTGSITVTVQPVPDAFATANRPNLCNGSAESITVTNPNGVGGVYDKMVTYGPVTGGTPSATNQPYGTFTETLTNPTGSVQTVTYRFTPKATTGIGCVGQPYTLTIVVQPAPSITCPGNVVTNTDAGQCSANVSGPAVAAGTVTPTGCNGGTTTYTYTIGGATTRTGSGNADGIFNKGVSTVRYTVTDPSGGTSSCTFTVTVNDNQAPVVTCATTATGTFFTPTDPGTCSHTSTGGEYTATQTDNCAATLTYQLTGATVAGPTTATTLAGQSFNRGSTLVTWKATDAAGNSSSCTFTVTIYDNQKPVFAGCPGNITVTSATANANGGGNTNTCNQTVTWTAPTNSDNCPGVASSTTHAPGSSFGLGTTTVTYTATDAAGNTQTCVFTVTVVDNTPPVISCPATATGTIFTPTDPGQCSHTATGGQYDAGPGSDNCGTISRTYTLTGATVGSATTNTLSLDGRVFNKGNTVVTWKFTDGSGNSSTCTFTVTIYDNQTPTVITCPAGGTRTTTTTTCGYTVSGTEFDVVATDNCPNTPIPAANRVWTLGGATTGTGTGTVSGTVFNKGITTINWVVTDGVGNTSACTVTVTVNDVTPPVITCPASPATKTANTSCVYIAMGTEFDATATDNCAPSPVPLSNRFWTLTGATTNAGAGTLSGTAFNKGTTTVTWIATDAVNNTSTSCTFTVTVTDVTPPAITCPGNQTRTASTVCNYTTVGTEFDATATDNCSPPDAAPVRTYTLSGATAGTGTSTLNGVVFNKGITTVTWVAMDASGNSATCSFTVRLIDITPAGDITASPNTTICAGQSGNVVVELTGVPPFTGVFNIQRLPAGATATYTWTAATAGFSTVFIPASFLTNSGPTNAQYRVTWNSLTQAGGCSQTAPSPLLTGSVDITVEPVADIAAVADRPNLCNNSAETITVTNPNGVGGTYNKVVNYGAFVTGGTATLTNQAYGPFTETLVNSSTSAQTVTYTFTPVSPGTLGCVGTSTTITITVQPAPSVVCPGNVVTSTSAGTCSATVTGLAPTFGPAGCNGGSTTVTYTVTGATTRSGVADASGSFNKGVSTVKYTVTDPSGSVVSCTFSVTVNDMQAPSITCPATATRSTNTGVCTWLSPNSNLDPTFSDNCTGTTIAYTSTGAGVVPSTGSTLSGTTFNRGVTVITWKATDAAGNSSSCTFTVTVQDTEKPTITSCPTSTTRPATLTPTCGYVVSGTEFDVQATDNCPATPVPGAQKVYTLTGQTSGTGTNTLAGKVLNLGATMVTWLVTDANGNTNACTFTVTVQDVNAPAITCPGNATRSTNPNVCTYRAMNTEFDATITDNCAGPNPAPARTYTLSGATTATGAGTLSGTLFNTGTTTVSWLATDGSGNTSTCSFTVIVTDNQTPVITCNGNRVVPTDPLACTYTHPAGDLTWNASVTENCGVVVLSYTLSGATTNTLGLSSLENQVFNKGVTLVTYTGKDVAGNSATCSFTVTVFDNQAPVINNCGTLSNTVRNTDQGVCTWMAGNTGGRNIDVSITENCAHTVTYTLSGATTMTAMPGTLSNTLFNKGVTTVNVTVADGTFTSTCMYTVTVNDNQLPLITTCPGTQTKSTDPDVCTYRVRNQEFDVVATDNCGLVAGNRTWVVTGAGATPSSGSGTMSNTVFNKGVSFVTWNVMDASGNTATPCTFTVTVQDNQAPRVVPSIEDQTLNTGGPGCQTTMPDYTGFVRSRAFDNCGTATGTLTITQAAPNQPGTTVIGFGGTRVLVFYLVDAAGNSTTVTFQLLLRDQTKPTAICKPATLFLGANGTVSVTVADVDNGSFDNCTPVTMTVSPTSFSCANTNTTNIVTLTVTDGNGNTQTCTSVVTVRDNTKPVITCPGDVTLYKDLIACTTVIPDFTGTATATDNCSVVSKVQSPVAGTIIAANVTQTLVTITATDASGNTATCTLTVFHRDTIRPTFTVCPGNFTVTSNSVSSNGGGNTTTCAQNVTWNASATDNCLSNGPVVITSVPPIGSSFALGTTTVTLTATDAAGNTQTCVFRVTVVDNTKPNITCGGTITFTTPAGGSSCTATVNVAPPIATDNCGTVTVTSNYAGNQFPIGSTFITWTATDGSGNTSSCVQEVRVTDGSKPQMTCPASITISPNTSGCVASATIAAPSPVTDCSGPVTITYAITGAGASGTSTGTGAVGSRIFNVGTTNITYTATDAAGNTNTCVTSVTVVNNLTGSISGTSTVVQNSGTTTAVVFTGSGGTTPYLFTYTITSNGNTNTYTVPTVSSNPSTSVAQSNAVLGVYVYKLIGVTDFYGCSGVITSQNTATVTVVSGPPDFTPTVDIASLSFTTPGQPRDFLVNINEISQLSPSLGAVQFRLVKPTAFTITYSTTSGISNVFGPQANNNSDWTFTEDAFFITVTLKHPAAQIPANSFSRIGFTITRKVGVAQNTSQNLTVTIVNGSGGDNNNSNNTSNTVVTAQ